MMAFMQLASQGRLSIGPIIAGITLAIALAAIQAGGCASGETILDCTKCPTMPATHVNDSTHQLSPAAQSSLVTHLSEFEDETATALFVHILPELPDGVALEKYTLACANCWSVGDRENQGRIIIFLFLRQRRIRI